MVWAVSLSTTNLITRSLSPVLHVVAFRVSKDPVGLRPQNLNCALPPQRIQQGYT
jgi:hypothetical protein